MFIKPVSDLHLEFIRPGGLYHSRDIPQYDMLNRTKDFCEPADTDKETILVLAGDIGRFDNPGPLKSFLQDMALQYHSVLYVAGNHEYYGSSIETGERVLEELNMLVPNLYVLTCSGGGVAIGEYVFYGDVMWTSISEELAATVRNWLNDYRLIHHSGNDGRKRLITPSYTSFLHTKQMMMISEKMDSDHRLKRLKPVLVSHHGPSLVADHPDFASSDVKSAFHNMELTNAQKQFYARFSLIIHGHTHRSHKTKDPATGVLTAANCYGYRGEAAGFNDSLLLSL